MLSYLALMGLLCVGCSTKKEVLPSEGRITIAVEEGEQLQETNRPLPSRPAVPYVRKALDYYGYPERGQNYPLNQQGTLIRYPHQGENIIVLQGVLYAYHQGKIERHNLVTHERMEPIPVTLKGSRVFLTASPSYWGLATDQGEVHVWDHQNRPVLTRTVAPVVGLVPLIEWNKMMVQNAEDTLEVIDLSTQKSFAYQHTVPQRFVPFVQGNVATLGSWKEYGIAGFSNGDIVVIHRDTQEVYWAIPDTSQAAEKNSTATPLVEENDLYVIKPTDGLYKFNLKDRSIVWHKETVKSYQTPLLAGRFIFVIQDRELVALDKLSGEVYYRKGGFMNPTAMGLFNGKLYVADQKQIAIVDPQTGDIQQALPIEEGKTKLLTSVQGQLVVVKEGAIVVMG